MPFPCVYTSPNRPSQHPYIREPGLSKVLRLARNAPLSEFQRACSQGIPVVVTGVDGGLHGDWGPEYFIERYGSHKVTLVDCESDCTRQSTVAQFFQDFLSACDRRQILKLKVSLPTSIAVSPDARLQDWPPQTHFRDEFPELFHAFTSIVPFGDVTRLDGVLNMAAHFPVNGIAPDLGYCRSFNAVIMLTLPQVQRCILRTAL